MIISTAQIEWEPFPTAITFNKEEIFVIKIDVPAYYDRISDTYTEILSEHELNNSLRFIHDKDRNRYILGMHLVKTVLSQILKTDAGDIEFKYSSKKKPFVNGVEFNVSHSGDCVILAISSHQVGIDIELIDPDYDYEELLTPNFHSQEIAYIRNNKNKVTGFYTLWTRKEAILKASGEGLTDELDKLSCLNAKIERNGFTYKLTSFKVIENYIACLATNTDENQIKYFCYN